MNISFHHSIPKADKTTIQNDWRIAILEKIVGKLLANSGNYDSLLAHLAVAQREAFNETRERYQGFDIHLVED